MCGIVGIFDRVGRLPSLELFQNCVNRLYKRGPDDGGTWTDRSVRLGHRRLAVVDLSPAGHQPMASADGRFVIVFNGESYNHVELRHRLSPPLPWRGTSDTETLLEAYRTWGSACLNRLNGMFAFAIWDTLKREMFLARDRLGVKPLYYSWTDGRLVFASGPSAMLALCADRSIDFQALRTYLELGYIPAPRSFYQHVHKLQAGHFLEICERRARAVRYWDYRHIEPDPALLHRAESELVEALDERLRRATVLRSRADVPVGVFLSGGTDSAPVLAMMGVTSVSTPKAFTIAFNEPEFNEAPVAARIASHLGAEHVVQSLSVQDLLQLLPSYVEEFDEPFADHSALPTMAVASLARQQVTVALTGDGGDELFGGYHYYHLLERLWPIVSLPAALKSALSATLARLPSHRAKLLNGALDAGSQVSLFHYLRSYSKDFPQLLCQEVLNDTGSSLGEFAEAAREITPGVTGAELGMRLDLALMLANGYLQKVDLATMANSLEAGNPLLDFQLVEWSMRLPLYYKMRAGRTKHLLKKVLCRYLPASLVYRPKRGVGMPMSQWLRGPLRTWANDLLHDRTLMEHVPWVPARVQDIFRSHLAGERDAKPLLWAVLMLLCYLSRHELGMELPRVNLA